jgi:hypothetical protein
LECGPLRTPGCADGRGEPLPDLGDDRRQVPFGDLGEVLGIGASLRPLLIPPAVRLKIAPGPVGPDGLEHAPGLGRRLVDRGGKAEHPLGVVVGPVLRLGEHARGDRPGGLGPGLVLDGRGLDAREGLEGGFWLPLLERLVDRLPGRGPIGGGNRIVTDGEGTHQNRASCEQAHHGDGGGEPA